MYGIERYRKDMLVELLLFSIMNTLIAMQGFDNEIIRKQILGGYKTVQMSFFCITKG